MLVVHVDRVPVARFESWTEMLREWGNKVGHGPVPGLVQVRKGVLGKVLVGDTKADVFDHARNHAEAEAETRQYRTEAYERNRARGRAYERGAPAFQALFA